MSLRTGFIFVLLAVGCSVPKARAPTALAAHLRCDLNWDCDDLNAAADSGDGAAQLALVAHCVRTGDACEALQDPALRSLLADACTAGDGKACLVDTRAHTGNDLWGFEWTHRQCGRLGDPRLCWELGHLYRIGLAEPEFQEAKRSLVALCESGVPGACVDAAAVLYSEGNLVAAEARMWRAAQLSSDYAGSMISVARVAVTGLRSGSRADWERILAQECASDTPLGTTMPEADRQDELAKAANACLGLAQLEFDAGTAAAAASRACRLGSTEGCVLLLRHYPDPGWQLLLERSELVARDCRTVGPSGSLCRAFMAEVDRRRGFEPDDVLSQLCAQDSPTACVLLSRVRDQAAPLLEKDCQYQAFIDLPECAMVPFREIVAHPREACRSGDRRACMRYSLLMGCSNFRWATGCERHPEWPGAALRACELGLHSDCERLAQAQIIPPLPQDQLVGACEAGVSGSCAAAARRQQSSDLLLLGCYIHREADLCFQAHADGAPRRGALLIEACILGSPRACRTLADAEWIPPGVALVDPRSLRAAADWWR